MGMKLYKRTKNRAMVEKIYSDLDGLERAYYDFKRGAYDSVSVQQLFAKSMLSSVAKQLQQRRRAKPYTLVDPGLNDAEFAQALVERNAKLKNDEPRFGAVDCGLSSRYSAILFG